MEVEVVVVGGRCVKRGEHHAGAAEEAIVAAVAAAGAKLDALGGQEPRPGVVVVVIDGQGWVRDEGIVIQ